MDVMIGWENNRGINVVPSAAYEKGGRVRSIYERE